MVCNKAGLTARRPAAVFGARASTVRARPRRRFARCLPAAGAPQPSRRDRASRAEPPSPSPAQARASSGLKVLAYKVTLKTPSGDQVIECADDVYILDAAEEAGASHAHISSSAPGSAGGGSRRPRGRGMNFGGGWSAPRQRPQPLSRGAL